MYYYGSSNNSIRVTNAVGIVVGMIGIMVMARVAG